MANQGKCTRYYEKVAIYKHPEVKIEWRLSAVAKPDYEERQKDGRYRLWKFIPEINKYIRVITLSDKETVHNVFIDRNFKGGKL